MSADARLPIFAAVTLGLMYFSRASLVRPRSHGFVRFFVFEIIAALILLNAPVWFHEPFSVHQIGSWALLLGSLVPLVLGVQALRLYGRQDSSLRQEPGLMHFERTSRLVKDGIFRYIRHPLYGSLLLLTWGVVLKNPSAVGAGLGVLVTAGLLMMAARDEAECLQVFGAAYRDYMRQTRRFIPYVY